jgi:hypothetical protein
MFTVDQHAHNTIKRKHHGEEITRALCIHGHFYQPAREDPLTGVIPVESGAAPFTNWNERVHEECYRPNAELGNFERISFNVGPTLMRWMEFYDPVTYQRILAQDRINLQYYGVGNAMAQPYHHTILPLATRQDKITEVAWGIADFEHRFARLPTGMWLPETAVDLESLEVMAEQGIEFTILAPWQAKTDRLDPTEPYWVELPSGRRIAVFFYQGALSGGVSFDQSLTSNAHEFALNNLSDYFQAEKEKQGEDQMLLIASDGELYGHHQAFRDWFLAYLVNGAGARAGIRLTFPALWLRDHAPQREIEIREFTSWSCHHGIARWMEDCDCIPTKGDWKAHLRLAFDHLAEIMDNLFQEAVQPYGIDPWGLRDRYIQVILGRRSVADLVSEMARITHPNGQTERISLLLEAQRERQRMYTSCGFFFEDFDRIEPQMGVASAAQAVWLLQKATGIDLQPDVIGDLAKVASQRSEVRGDQVFERFIRRAREYSA